MTPLVQRVSQTQQRKGRTQRAHRVIGSRRLVCSKAQVDAVKKFRDSRVIRYAGGVQKGVVQIERDDNAFEISHDTCQSTAPSRRLTSSTMRVAVSRSSAFLSISSSRDGCPPNS